MRSKIRGSDRPTWVLLGVLGIIFDLIALTVLVFGYFLLHLNFGGTPPHPDPQQLLVYVVTAACLIAIGFVSLVASIYVRATGVAIAQSALVFALILVAGLSQMPQGVQGETPAPSRSANPSYTPCYSGSGNCN